MILNGGIFANRQKLARRNVKQLVQLRLFLRFGFFGFKLKQVFFYGLLVDVDRQNAFGVAERAFGAEERFFAFVDANHPRLARFGVGAAVVNRNVFDQVHTLDVHNQPDDVAQAHFAAQAGCFEFFRIDKTIGEDRPVEDFGGCVALVEHFLQGVKPDRRRKVTLDSPNDAGVNQFFVGIRFYIDDGTNRNRVDADFGNLHQILAQIAVQVVFLNDFLFDLLFARLDLGVGRINFRIKFVEIEQNLVKSLQGKFLLVFVFNLERLVIKQFLLAIHIHFFSERQQPRVFHAFGFDEKLAVIRNSYRFGRQNFFGPEELPRERLCVPGFGEQIFDGQVDAVAEIGDGIGQQFEHRNARVVRVVVGPYFAAHFGNVIQPELFQERKIQVVAGGDLG